MSIKNYYFDYASTTPLDHIVRDKMISYLQQDDSFGNAGSSHYFGKKAKEGVDLSREQVAGLIKANPSEIIFTSCASESVNLALKGVIQRYLNSYNKKPHIITSATEHKAVLNAASSLSQLGCEVTYLRPDNLGQISAEQVEGNIKENTILVSLIHVNNEIGVITDIEKIAKLTSSKGILLHVDAAQSLGRVKIDLSNTPIDLLSCASHKIYGPKGAGALYIRKNPRLKLSPLIDGGGQEGGLRSGTLSTINIIGMGEACWQLKNNWDKDRSHIKELSDYFLENILNSNKDNKFSLNAIDANRVPDILSLSVGEDADVFIKSRPQIAISAGSACSSGAMQASHVLSNLGMSPLQAQQVVRVSFGRMSTKDEVELLISEFLR